ncbi:CAP domain-containing protein [Saccharopolyspora taberi]|uniref:CAP domain-containing protein n=1 Tax=Saccharopolyspora taberi TaxID=60895 RepID=UPI0031DC40DC
MLIAAGSAATLAPTAVAGTAEQSRVVELVNQARAKAGCGAVTTDARLTNAAQKHSADMANRSYFDHTSPNGVTFAKRITDAGYPSPGAENIAMGQTSADQVMDAWMKSAGHKANILNCSLKTIGVGVEPNGWYWTQDFGR